MKVYVEAHGCTQSYGEARLMQEALARNGCTITPSEGDADAHVLVTCTVIETTERRMVRRMTELAAHDKPLVVAGCMAAAQRERVLATVPRAKLVPPRKWPQIVELLGTGTSCGDRADCAGLCGALHVLHHARRAGTRLLISRRGARRPGPSPCRTGDPGNQAHRSGHGGLWTGYGDPPPGTAPRDCCDS